MTPPRRVCLPLYPTLTLPRFLAGAFVLDYNHLQIIARSISGIVGARTSTVPHECSI